jgi:hypothetical protein
MLKENYFKIIFNSMDIYILRKHYCVKEIFHINIISTKTISLFYKWFIKKSNNVKERIF